MIKEAMVNPPEHPKSKGGKRSARKWIFCVAVVLALGIAWFAVTAASRDKAAKQLRAMGFEAGIPDIAKQIQKNWRGLFDRKFWEWRDRVRVMSWKETNLERCTPALVHFKPLGVLLGFSKTLDDVSLLRRLPKLERLDFYECPSIKDLEVVRELKDIKELTFQNSPALRSLAIIQSGRKLRSLHIGNCPNLISIASLRELTSLRSLELVGCPALEDTELLKGMSELEELDISRCSALTDLKGLHGLRKLKSIKISGCSKLTPGEVAELRAAFPKVKIELPW